MAATDGQVMVAAARWAENGVYLKEFVSQHKLPAVVKIIKGQYGGIGVPSLPSPGLQQTALLLSAGRRKKIIAQAVKLKEGYRVIGVGPKVAIPDSYPGYFELLSEEGRSVRCVDSVVELSRRRPETGFLVRDSIRAVSGRFNDDGSISVDGARTVVEGETLRVEGKVLPNGCKSRYLRCTDHQGRTVLLGLDQRGRFSTLAREDSIGGVHTVRDLLNKRLPLTVRLVHGPPPRGLKNPSQFIPELRLLTSVEEEHVFALPLQKDTGVVIPLPLAAPLKIQKTRNEDRLRSLREYQRLLERCGRLVDEVVDRAYALEGKLGDTKRAPVACFIRRSPPPSDHIDDENRIPGGDDYDEIDRLYDYVRGFPPQPRNKPDPPPVETIPGKKPYVKNNRSQKPRQKTTGGSPLFDIRYKSLSDLQQDSSGDSAKLPEKKTKRLTSRPRSLTNLVWEQRKPARIGTLYL
ncbi:CABIT domain-containing protein serrano [Lycorma delicatula]|uniref:CABIT domain-containing protein serrano n=1 Tax=Lycorma delicatula TaxID=130591 RepID=UPI003F512779